MLVVKEMQVGFNGDEIISSPSLMTSPVVGSKPAALLGWNRTKFSGQELAVDVI